LGRVVPVCGRRIGYRENLFCSEPTLPYFLSIHRRGQSPLGVLKVHPRLKLLPRAQPTTCHLPTPWEGEGKDTDRLQIIVPAEAKEEILRSWHNSPVGGSIGYERTRQSESSTIIGPSGNVVPHVRRLFPSETPAPSSKRTIASLPDQRTKGKNFHGHFRTSPLNKDRKYLLIYY
jgi:hypothetical protein